MTCKKILIADDDPAIVDALSIILELAEYKVSSILDGKVIPMIQQEKPDLLLLDIWMSGVDGREICKILKKREQTKKLPIIIISASLNVEKSSRDSGADDFLEKPFEMDDLLNKVKKYIN